MDKQLVKILMLIFGLFTAGVQAQPIIDTICVTAGPSNLGVPYQSGFEYHWQINGGILLSQPDSNDVLVDWGPNPGYFNISVTATPPNGCGDTSKAVICLVAPTKASLAGPNVVCKGSLVVLTTSATNFSWQGGKKDEELTFIAEKDTTVYLVSQNTPCTADTAYHAIHVVEPPKAYMNTIEDTLQLGQEANMYYTGGSGVVVDWYYDDDFQGSGTYQYYHFDEEGDHVITQVVSDGTCSDTIKRYVYVQKIFKLFIPSAFTPDGDGVNDIFLFKGMGIAKYTALIYNRWGEMVYSWDENGEGWDGKQNGREVPVGVYTYKVVIEDITGLEVVRRGTFNLVR